MEDKMTEQFHYYIEHQEEILKKYNGKAVILKDFEIVGVYESEWDAFKIASQKYESGTFIVQRVSPGTEAYTVTVSSNFAYMGA